MPKRSNLPSSALIEDLRRRAGPLPAFDRLDALHEVLGAGRNAVLIAPPGAGKTSIVAPSMLDAAWLEGRRILLVLPRRLATRAAAERIASLLGEEVGGRVGYRMRLESRMGPDCRIECVTEGIFLNRIISDPELADYGLLLFDEVHERNRDSDLGLSLAIDVQGGLRDDLRIVAMSATLDGARFSGLLDGPVIESEGRQYPIDIRHIGRAAGRMEDMVARAVEAGMAAEDGNMLVFLPGVAEIERVAERLRLPEDIALHRLHGSADPRDQKAAIAASTERKCVLATAIAETSLTIPGVRLVVDAGLSRRPRFDRGSGLTRLVTERASQAALAQRAGRAGRQAPGVVWRLWEEGETRSRILFDPPEILESDLAPLLLQLAAYGVTDPAMVRWLDPPPDSAVATARAQLVGMDAMDSGGRLTAHGRALSELPLPPRLAHMLIVGAAGGAGAEAARIALLLQEPGLGGRSGDLHDRLAAFARDRSPRAEKSRQLARRWAMVAERLAGVASEAENDAATLAALAFPDRVARRRRSAGASDSQVTFLMQNGRGLRIDATDALAREEWIVALDVGGGGADSRLQLGIAFPPESVARWVAAHGETDERPVRDPATGRIWLERQERLGAISIARRRSPAPPEIIAGMLLSEAQEAGFAALPWSPAERELLVRLAFARAHGFPCFDPDAAMADAETWLAPRLSGVDRLAAADMAGALDGLMGWSGRQALEAFAPRRLETPAGTGHVIDYGAEGGPEAEVRVQALFGLKAHPMVAGGRVPLALALLSPGGRVIQKTRDLPAFWAGSWRDVQRDMKGRYPRHPWPDDPAAAPPTVRTKAADARLKARD